MPFFEIVIEVSGRKHYRVEADNIYAAIALSQYSNFPNDYNAFCDLSADSVVSITKISESPENINHE